MEDLQKWFLYDFDIGQKKLNPVIIIIIIITTISKFSNLIGPQQAWFQP